MGDHASHSEHRFAFTRRLRLTGPAQYKSVHEGGLRVSVPPLLVYARPNQLGHPRLGLAVSRRAGNAVVRNAIKRRLREAFRLMQHDLPAYDFVITSRKHDPLVMEAYRSMFADAVKQLKHKWSRKGMS